MTLRCQHTHIRCIHGDEILSTARAWRRPTFARVRCLDCGRALYEVDLPATCSVTGGSHGGVV